MMATQSAKMGFDLYEFDLLIVTSGMRSEGTEIMQSWRNNTAMTDIDGQRRRLKFVPRFTVCSMECDEVGICTFGVCKGRGRRRLVLYLPWIGFVHYSRYIW